MLNASAIGGEISTADWLDFKNNEVSALERLVNNNPLLYGVRVYAVNDSVQEMMPILYNASRMKNRSGPSRINMSAGILITQIIFSIPIR